MHFLVLGGTGQNGLLVIQEALARGHSVTALARNPNSFKIDSHPQLTVVKGTPESPTDITTALKTPRHPDTVIVALGLTSSSPTNLLTVATESLLSALRASSSPGEASRKQPKLIVNSSQGVGASAPSLNIAFRVLFNYWERMRLSQAAHEEADAIVMASGFPYVVARPCRLTDGGDAGAQVKDFPDGGKGVGCMPSVSRASLARWLVVAAESDAWDGRAPVLAN